MTSRSFGITTDYVESFLYKQFPDPNPVLAAVDEFGQKNGIPIVGPLVGRFLHLLVRACKPASALEIGTAIGYSTIWLASALPKSSTLTTIELDEERVTMARKNMEDAGLSSRVSFVVGDAEKVVPAMKSKYDFIFLDTEKYLYPKLLSHLLRMLRVGGFLVADNTLWSGRVATSDRSRATLSVKYFNGKIINDAKLFSIIVPIRDGVSLSYKLRDR